MKNFLLTLLILLGHISFGQDKVKVTIQVEGISNRTGQLSVAIYDSPATYMNQAVKSFKLDLSDYQGDIVVMHELPVGEYAITILHDENSNGQLDFGPMGPLENYGFSNNPSALYGPADYESAKFLLDANTVLTITVQ